MIKEAFVAWILTTMTTLAPPHRPHWEPAARESHEQADARYQQIAEAIVDGVFDPNLEPVLGGKRARQNTAMLVAIWWYGESGFRRDVDLGLGRARLAKTGWNDYGRSWCMGQISLGRKSRPDPEFPGKWIEDSPSTTAEGWSGRELCQDRSKCLRATVRIMRQSFQACWRMPFGERLAAYAAGTCEHPKGRSISRHRMALFHKWLHKNKRPKHTDAVVMAEIKQTMERSSEKFANADTEKSDRTR